MNKPFDFYKEVLDEVPAYNAYMTKYLQEHPSLTISEFSDIPLLTKKDYLLEYPIEDLCKRGDFANIHFIGSSSGFSKSGSVFWPKCPADELDYMTGLEAMLRNCYQIDTKRTLIFCCMALGTWIGGMTITSTLRVLSAQGRNPITVATPGLNLQEAVEIYSRFHTNYEQTLWITNPSNINLIYALIKRKGIDFAPASNFFPVVGEYYTESFREKVATNFGHSPDAPFVVWTGYGSADTGDLGAETEATIKLRKHIRSRADLNTTLFESDDTPMILQLADKGYVEIIDNQIVVTKNQLIPIVRYNTGDCGGLLTKTDLQKYNIPTELFDELPEKMIYVFGRATDNIIFYGTNLNVVSINEYFQSLDESFGYGGLFQVQPTDIAGVTYFRFTVYTSDSENKELQSKYYNELVNFLKAQSNEFTTKYDNLSKSLGEPLISVELADLSRLNGNVKHKFII